MSLKLLALYFLLGGVVVAMVTYFGTQGKGLLAAFIALFPAVTVVTMVTIYLNGGVSETVAYFKSLLYLLPAWLLYVISAMLLLPKLGPAPSVIIGIALYIGAALLTMRFVH